MEKTKWHMSCLIYPSQSNNQKIQQKEAKKKALEYFFKSMLNKLMSGKLRVNIVES